MERRSPNGKGLDLHFYPTSRRILAIMYLLQQLLLGSKDTVWVGTKVSIDPLILVACWEQLLGDSTIWSLRKLFFKEKFTKNSYYPIFKSQPGSVLWKSTEIRGKLGAVPWWQHHLDSQEKSFLKQRYYLVWKWQPGSISGKSTAIRGKQVAVLGGQHYLESQEAVLQKSLLKRSYSQVWKLQPGSVIRGKATRHQCMVLCLYDQCNAIATQHMSTQWISSLS